MKFCVVVLTQNLLICVVISVGFIPISNIMYQVKYIVKAMSLEVVYPMMASEGRSKNEETFVIRHATSLDDLQWVIKLASEEGFAPRKKEAECYFSAGLTPYFYIGELNEK